MRATFFINRRYNLGIYLNVIRGASLKQKFAYILFLWGVLALPSAVQAIGLGEPGQEPVLGQRLDLSIPLLGVGQSLPDASCFRVVKPRAAGDLPWLRQADIQVVAGSVPRLRLRSDVVREPLFQIAIDLGCGNDLYREYTLLANPVLAEAPPPVQAAPEVVEKPPRQSKKRERSEARRAPARPKALATSASAADMQTPPGGGAAQDRPPAYSQPAAGEQGGDRFFLSASDESGETSLRLSMVLGEHMLRESAFSQEQRETLRLEYQMLAALHERATDQLAMAEKLRSMEGALNDLQGRAAGLQERAAAADAVSSRPAAQPATPVAQPEESTSDWGWYGLILALVLLLAGGLYWRQRREQEGRDENLLHGEPLVDAPRQAELNAQSRSSEQHVDVHLEPGAGAKSVAVDFELDGGASIAPVAPVAPPAALQPRHGDSIFSINATSVDEHFEANPVMELADIMLSFGRVKGAAQALQEYIDNNPQEALQPWVRLLEVYRMADMRDEFTAVASSLNQHFNVEIQPWEVADSVAPASAEDNAIETEQSARARGVEDMPRIVAGLTKQWASPEVLVYMQQLLRDNRAGQRQGFPLPVVEEILFLIELKETALNMERELTEA